MSDQPSTHLTRAQEFNQQLDQQAENFRALLPSHISLEKFKRVVVVAVSQNPDLFRADRRSFFNAAQKCAADGLLPDGREAALVVYNTKMKVKLPDGTQQEQWVPMTQYLPMVAGIRKRMRNSGEVTSAEAYVVYKNDKFFQKLGDDPAIVHEPPVFGVDRGEPVGAYAIIRLKNGEILREAMDYAEIERVRAVSRSKDGPAWRNWWSEMARKVVLRRCSKAAPNSAEIDALLGRDDEAPALPSLVELPAMEPEPQRQLEADREQPGTCYTVTDADSEVHEYETAQATGEAIELIFTDAARRGRAALDAAAENNGGAVQQLRAAGHGGIADAVVGHWHELAADLDPFGLPPATQQASPTPTAAEHPGAASSEGAPPRQGEPSPAPAPLLGEAELTIPLRPHPKPAELDFFHRQLMAMIAERPLDATRAAWIKDKNERGIGFLKLRNVEQYDAVMAALHQTVVS
jgi:phage RecT family recombinase